MKINKDKLDPDIFRWIQEDKMGERTIIVRYAFSQNPDQVADALEKTGMRIQSSGPGVLVASSNPVSVRQAIHFQWVIKIELPRPLDMKSKFPKL